MEEISDLEDEISEYESQISKLNSKITELKKSIEKNEKEITKLEAEYEEKQEVPKGTACRTGIYRYYGGVQWLNQCRDLRELTDVENYLRQTQVKK